MFAVEEPPCCKANWAKVWRDIRGEELGPATEESKFLEGWTSPAAIDILLLDLTSTISRQYLRISTAAASR